MKEFLSRISARLSRYAWFRFLLRYGEIIRYGIVGVLTTGVNFAVYLFLSRLLFPALLEQNEELYAFVFNWISWGCAVVFAFFANRSFVFGRHERGKVLLIQLLCFVSLRVASGVFENFSPSLLIKVGVNDLAAKSVVAVAVIILNYLFTKFITFAKRNSDPKSAGAEKISDLDSHL